MVRNNWAIIEDLQGELDLHTPMSEKGSPKKSGQKRAAMTLGPNATSSRDQGHGRGHGHHTTTSPSAITPDRLFVRIERQSFIRLPKSGYVCFGGTLC